MRTAVVAALAMLMLTSIAWAQYGEPLVDIVRGAREWSVSGSLVSNDDTVWAVAGRYGWMIRDDVQAGAIGTVSGDGDTLWSVDGYVEKLWVDPERRTVPYVGAFVGGCDWGPETDVQAGIMVGLKVFTNPTNGVDVQARWRHVFGDLDDDFFELLVGMFGFTLPAE